MNGMEQCPCGRPDLGQHEKHQATWLCRAAYMEKEIRYALSELDRPGDAWRGQSWRALGLARLEKLV